MSNRGNSLFSIIAVSILILFCSCETTNLHIKKDNIFLEKVKIGMTKSQISNVVGNPHSLVNDKKYQDFQLDVIGYWGGAPKFGPAYASGNWLYSRFWLFFRDNELYKISQIYNHQPTGMGHVHRSIIIQSKRADNAIDAIDLVIGTGGTKGNKNYSKEKVFTTTKKRYFCIVSTVYHWENQPKYDDIPSLRFELKKRVENIFKKEGIRDHIIIGLNHQERIGIQQCSSVIYILSGFLQKNANYQECGKVASAGSLGTRITLNDRGKIVYTKHYYKMKKPPKTIVGCSNLDPYELFEPDKFDSEIMKLAAKIKMGIGN